MKQPKRICDVCGRNCTLFVGTYINLDDKTNSVPEIKSIRELFGKAEFSICFTCWLLSLGIRPKEKK